MAQDDMSDAEIVELSNSMGVELRNCLSSDIVLESGSKFCLITRIHEHIRMIDRYSYEPMIVSIGPYHNGSPALSSMEKEKWNCLDYVLKLNCEKSLKDYLTFINSIEKRARVCYSGDIKMNKKKFLQTLLLDGCFVLISLGGYNEFIRPQFQNGMSSSSHAEIIEEDSSSGQVKVMAGIQQMNSGTQNASQNSVIQIELSTEISGNQEEQCQYQDNTQQIGRWYDVFVSLDLLLMENQIPFFIVEGIYEVLISNTTAQTTTCTTSVAQHIEMSVPFYPKSIGASSRPKDFDHLLHLCHMYFRASSNDDDYHEDRALHYIHHLLQLGQEYFSHLGLSQDGHFPDRWRRATQYHEAGIEFRRRTYCERNPHSLLDIKLRDGVLEVPFLLVDEKVSILFRNFIALEQTCPQVGNDVTAYIIFMAKLMSMPDDVALLARKGIVAHHMRTDKEVSQLFTKLMKGVVFDFHGKYYLSHLCLALEAYYQNRLHRWVAWLRHNHFSNPWLVVAAVAGVIVLFCTIAQTVLTVESYANP